MRFVFDTILYAYNNNNNNNIVRTITKCTYVLLLGITAGIRLFSILYLFFPTYYGYRVSADTSFRGKYVRNNDMRHVCSTLTHPYLLYACETRFYPGQNAMVVVVCRWV